jgi:hypothetical protein
MGVLIVDDDSVIVVLLLVLAVSHDLTWPNRNKNVAATILLFFLFVVNISPSTYTPCWIFSWLYIGLNELTLTIAVLFGYIINGQKE